MNPATAAILTQPPTNADSPTPQQMEPVTTIFERSVQDRRAAVLPPAEVPERALDELIPARLLRDRPAELPEVSEPEIVRHYNRISRRNFDVDTGPYPLGSCTMKHNPRLNERVAALPGHARLHPAQDPKRAQGALELMWLLERALAEITGLEHVSLQPSAEITLAPAAPTVMRASCSQHPAWSRIANASRPRMCGCPASSINATALSRFGGVGS